MLINLLSDTWFAKTFLPSCRVSFHFLNCFFFSGRNICVGCSPMCWFLLPCLCFRSRVKKEKNPTLPRPTLRSSSLRFLLGVLGCQVLHFSLWSFNDLKMFSSAVVSCYYKQRPFLILLEGSTQPCVFFIRYLHIPLETIPPPQFSGGRTQGWEFSSPEDWLRYFWTKHWSCLWSLLPTDPRSCLRKQCSIWPAAGAKPSHLTCLLSFYLTNKYFPLAFSLAEDLGKPHLLRSVWLWSHLCVPSVVHGAGLTGTYLWFWIKSLPSVMKNL